MPYALMGLMLFISEIETSAALDTKRPMLNAIRKQLTNASGHYYVWMEVTSAK